MLITCWYLCFQDSWALWFAIRCRCLANHCSASSPLTFLQLHSASALFSGFVCFYADPLHNHPSLESAMPRAPVLATICGCGTNFIAFLYKAQQKCAHIYIYANTSSESAAAVIKISNKSKGAVKISTSLVPIAAGF